MCLSRLVHSILRSFLDCLIILPDGILVTPQRVEAVAEAELSIGAVRHGLIRPPVVPQESGKRVSGILIAALPERRPSQCIMCGFDMRAATVLAQIPAEHLLGAIVPAHLIVTRSGPGPLVSTAVAPREVLVMAHERRGGFTIIEIGRASSR